MTSAELFARAAIAEGKYAQAFPSFGPERRGAPVLAFDRIDKNRSIRIRAEVTEPDIVVVLDPGLLTIVDVASGLKQGGIIIVNSKKPAEQLRRELGFTAVTLSVTNSNSRALHLYEQLRFSTIKEFQAFACDAPETEREPLIAGRG